MTAKEIASFAYLALAVGYVWKLVSLDHVFKWKQLLLLGVISPLILLVEFVGFISPYFNIELRLNIYAEIVTDNNSKPEGDK
jgi:hypothetical protein